MLSAVVACSSGSDITGLTGDDSGTRSATHDAGKSSGKGADARANDPSGDDTDTGSAGDDNGDGGGGGDDANPDGDDAGMSDDAGGNAPMDAGRVRRDAGTTPPVDAGTTPPVDAGTTPPVDAGKAPGTDAGTGPVTDAGKPPVDAGAAADASTTDASSADPEQLCVDTVNGYRATLGLPALKRWSAEETCTDGQAQADYVAKKAHSAFGQCKEGGQCECPGWSGWSGTPASTIQKCLAAMWAEGPGGGHYDIMSSKDYTMVSCGFYSTAGTTTSTQDYK